LESSSGSDYRGHSGHTSRASLAHLNRNLLSHHLVAVWARIRRTRKGTDPRRRPRRIPPLVLLKRPAPFPRPCTPRHTTNAKASRSQQGHAPWPVFKPQLPQDLPPTRRSLTLPNVEASFPLLPLQPTRRPHHRHPPPSAWCCSGVKFNLSGPALRTRRSSIPH
jgi:hypothetical protein